MADKFSPDERSRIMSRVKSRDTAPEKIVRNLLHKLGYRFRLHVKNLPGNPDIVLSRHKKIIFVHGCFWHGHKDCARAKKPTSNIDFWNKKLERNIKRDKKTQKKLKLLGWRVLVLWQCQIRNRQVLQKRLEHFMDNVE